MLAAIQAPVIMMSQNRQDTKDRLRGELDYAVNRRAAADIQGLASKLNVLGDNLQDLKELLAARAVATTAGGRMAPRRTSDASGRRRPVSGRPLHVLGPVGGMERQVPR